MAQFLNGAQLVDAFRWTADEDQAEDPTWMVDAIKSGTVRFTGTGSQAVRMLIHTPSRTVQATPGDWIIREPSGAIKTLAPEVFQRHFRKEREAAMCD